MKYPDEDFLQAIREGDSWKLRWIRLNFLWGMPDKKAMDPDGIYTKAIEDELRSRGVDFGER